MEKKFAEVDELKKPSESSKEKIKHLPIAQVFLKIISAQIEVKEGEAKFSKKIQDSDLIVQTNYDFTFKTKPATGSLLPQWHAGYTFAVRDLNTSIKLKLISTKRLINTTLGKVSISLETMVGSPNVVELPLENISKKLKSIKLLVVTMCIREDAATFAKNYSVIRNITTPKKFNHLNSPYYTSKGFTKEHPSFKIVLERANYFAGEVVRGAIIFDATHTIEHINHIKVAASCTESSIWTEGSGSNQVTYADARVWFAIEKYLISTFDTDGVPLFAGMHVFPFELQLPTQARSSVGYNGANMSYLISAECMSVKNWRTNKSASAFFNVYGPETQFQPPLVYNNPPAHINRYLKDDWTGEVRLSSQKQYPNKEYGMLIKFHNVNRVAVKSIKIALRLLKKLQVDKPKFKRSLHTTAALLKEIVPMNNTTDENVQIDFKYTLPAFPPTVAPVDGIQLFEFHTIAVITAIFADGKKHRRVVPITVGTIIPEEFAREPHEINIDAVAGLTVYSAKSPMVHGLVAYKSTSVQFFDEKIFKSYHPSQLIRIENVSESVKVDVDNFDKNNTNNNNQVINNNNSHPYIDNNGNNSNNNNASFGVEEDRPMRNKYVDIDDDELPDSDESKSM